MRLVGWTRSRKQANLQPDEDQARYERDVAPHQHCHRDFARIAVRVVICRKHSFSNAGRDGGDPERERDRCATPQHRGQWGEGSTVGDLEEYEAERPGNGVHGEDNGHSSGNRVAVTMVQLQRADITTTMTRRHACGKEGCGREGGLTVLRQLCTMLARWGKQKRRHPLR